MNLPFTVTQNELSDILLNIAPTRPVFIWGAPGIGKSALVQNFADEVGMECVSLLGSQLAPEDIIGIPRINGEVSEFLPPKMIARKEPYVLFLDELNAMPYSVQGKLLRVLQEGTFRPLGASKEKKVNVKIIAAINVDPMEAIENNTLRKDLFYRLSSSMIYLPPLRERPDDIEYLTDNYIDYFNDQYGKNVKGISEHLREFFLSYSWEGNVRELKHVIEAMITMTGSEILDIKDIPVYLSGKSKERGKKKYEPSKGESRLVIDLENDGTDLREAVDRLEREMIIKVLGQCNGNKTKAGELLGIPRQTLKYKMDRLEIPDDGKK